MMAIFAVLIMLMQAFFTSPATDILFKLAMVGCAVYFIVKTCHKIKKEDASKFCGVIKMASMVFFTISNLAENLTMFVVSVLAYIAAFFIESLFLG